MRLASLLAVLFAAFGAVHGCVDTTPIDYVEPPRDSGTSVSDAAIFGEGGLAAACRECVTGPTCAEAYTTCIEDERCTTITECLIDAYCFNFDITDLAHLKPCILECALEAGILSAEDPVAPLFAQVIRCAQYPDRCGPVCNVQ